MTQSELEKIGTCPACDGRAIDDSIEAFCGVCENCGFVIREDTDSVSFEWDTTDGTFGRTEDKGWLSECRVRSGTEQQIAQAFKTLEEVANQLDLPNEIREETADIYCDAFRAELTDGRETASVVAACLHFTSRRMGSPIPMSRLTEFPKIEETKFNHSYLAICDELENELRMPKPVEYVSFLQSMLEFTDSDREAVEELVIAAEGKQAFVGKDPAGVAAGGVYVLQEQVTQSAAAEAVGLSTETVRQRAKQLQEALDRV